MSRGGADFAKPLRGLGDFYATALDTLILIPQRPFAWREFLLQSWFIARVSIVPALLLAVPFTVLAAFTLNILLFDFGAADFAGTGAELIDLDTALEQCGVFVILVDHDMFKSVPVEERAGKAVYDTRGIWPDQPRRIAAAGSDRIAV